MAGGRENLNLQSKTSEFMDQPSVQHEHVVTIPPAANASSIASSSAAAVGFQTLNFPSKVPCEGVPTAVSTSDAANTQGQSCAPRQQRSRWNNPCFLLTFDFYSTSIQTILLVVFLRPVFRDEPAHTALQAWVICCGIGCLLYRGLFRTCIRTYIRSREQSNRLPQFVSVSPGSKVDESQTSWRQRFGIQILKWLWTSLGIFFELAGGVGVGIVYTRWATTQAPRLNWLCIVCLVMACFRFIPPMMVGILMSIWYGTRAILRHGPRKASANLISVYKYHACETLNQAYKEDEVKVSIGGDERVGTPASS